MSSIENNNQVIEKTRSFLTRFGVQKGARIGIGLSGGADSTGLTFCLAELREEWDFHLVCCYLDHGIRPEKENNRDKEFIEQYCRRLHVEVCIGKIEPGIIEARCREEKRSIEEAAREERYSFYSRIRDDMKLDYIAVGHTNDDLMETVIMRFFQGSGVEGLMGIPPRRDRIIRPLIRCTREEVTGFLRLRGESWREDLSNSENRYLRNKVRNEMIPLVEKVFPGYRRSLNTLVKKMTASAELTEREMASVLPWEKEGDAIRVDRDAFIKAPEAILLHTLYRMMNSLQAGTSDRIPYHFFNSALRYGEGDEHRVVLRGYGVVFRRRGENLFLESDVVLKRKKGYFIVVDFGSSYLVSDNVKVSADLGMGKPQRGDWLYVKDIAPPLIARSRRSGDAIRLRSGRKSIKKLFNEWGIPEVLRSDIPVVEDRTGIVAVLGEPYGGRNRVRERDSKRKLTEKEEFLVFTIENG